MQRNIAALVSITFLLFGSTTAAMAATLPDGAYRCEMYAGMTLMHLGDIAISGNTYRGPAHDLTSAEAHEYELTDAGTINWGGPMGGFDSGGNTIVSTTLKDNGGSTAFDITMQLESGNFSTVSCFS